MPVTRSAGRARLRPREIGLAAAVVFAAIAVRIPFLSHESIDNRFAANVWYDFIVANGYFHSWQYDFAHYTPFYLYLLTAAAYFLPSAPVWFAVKGVSILGDFGLAFYSYRCVRLRYPESRTVPLLASGAVLLAPTVVLNSARWGQVDAIYTAFLLACLYGLLTGRGARAFAAFGLAFAFKAQALFLAPLLYWLSAKKVVGGRYFWWIPAVFLAALVPAWAAGRGWFDLLSVYAVQTGFYSELTMAAPNLYQWISNDHYRWWPVGVLLTLALVHGVRRLLESRRIEMTRETVVFLALFSVLLVPFFLPKMMDRYFFPADVLAIVLAFYRPRLWYVPAAIGAASLTAYARSSFFWLEAPLGWAAALLLFVLVVLTRRLLPDLGVRFDFRSAGRWLRRRARTGRAAAAPILTLLLAFAALFAVFAADGRLARPLQNDGESARTLARAAERPAESGLYEITSSVELVPLPAAANRLTGSGLGATRLTLDAEGRLAYEAVPGGSAAFDYLLAAALGHFGDDLSSQVAAARSLMLALLGGAALFAYLSLCRALAFRWPERRDSNRWVALAATLLAFGSAAAAGADTVSVSGAPEVFGVFVVFHGMVVFLGEGRFWPLFGKSAAALLLGFSAVALLAPFVVLGLLGEWRRRRLRVDGDGAKGIGEMEPFLRPFPAVSLRGGLIGSPYLALGGCCAVFSALLAAAGGVGGAAGGPSGGGASVRPAGQAEVVGDGGEFPEGLRRIGAGFVPPAALPGGPSAGEGATGDGGAWAAAGALLAAAGLAGAALLRSFPLVVLALSGLGSALWLGRGAPAEVAALGALGLPLAAWTAGLAGLRWRWGGRSAGAAAGAAAAIWALSWGGASSSGGPGVSPGGGRRPAPGAGSPEAREATERLREDFGRIRRVLRRRAERTVFLPPLVVGSETLAGARARFFLPGAASTDDPARRGFAEFTVEAEPGPAGGSLTPRNREVFLHHRAAYDGELDGLVEAAGAPAARSEFDVHLGGGRLLFVKDGCRPEHRDGIFLVYLWPEDPDDLPPHRKQYGFENRSFPFARRAYETGDRCVAGIRFPEYPVRRVSAGRSFRRARDSYEEVWQVEFSPPDRAERDRRGSAPAGEPRAGGFDRAPLAPTSALLRTLSAGGQGALRR